MGVKRAMADIGPARNARSGRRRKGVGEGEPDRQTRKACQLENGLVLAFGTCHTQVGSETGCVILDLRIEQTERQA